MESLSSQDVCTFKAQEAFYGSGAAWGWRIGTGSSEEQEVLFLCLHLCWDPDPAPLPVGSRRVLPLYVSGSSPVASDWTTCRPGGLEQQWMGLPQLLLWAIGQGFRSLINNVVNCHSAAFVKAFHKKSQLRRNDKWV